MNRVDKKTWQHRLHTIAKEDTSDDIDLEKISKLIFEPVEDVFNVSTEGSAIADFYKGKCVFVTGATGFLGKILVEKLLRACVGIETIYILIREKKGKEIQQRIKEMCEDVIFSPLSKIRPNFWNKIVGIKGDASLPEMGISSEDKEVIKQKVSIIFHAAATVRFDEKLKKAVLTNIRSTKDILQLARGCQNLQSFVYVGTAYSSCIKGEIEEVFSKPPYDTEGIMNLVNIIPEETMDKITPTLLGKYPNTYTLSKATAEETIHQYGKGLPICIFRPSVVVSTYREPLRSWTDNLYGPTGVAVSASVGVLRTLYCDENVAADIVPVDLVVNAMIAVSYQNYNKPALDSIPIYNYVSGPENKITWGRYMEVIQGYGFDYPSIRAIWYYNLKLNKYKFIDWLYILFLHFTTAIVLDTFAIISGNKPQLVTLYKKIHKFTDAIAYFSTNNWTFSNHNTQKLWNDLQEIDRKIFPFSMKEISWDYYAETNLLGMRVFVLKDDISTLPAARRRFKRLAVLHYTVKYLSLFIILYALVHYFL